jgi:hypothetical protein
LLYQASGYIMFEFYLSIVDACLFLKSEDVLYLHPGMMRSGKTIISVRTIN